SAAAHFQRTISSGVTLMSMARCRARFAVTVSASVIEIGRKVGLRATMHPAFKFDLQKSDLAETHLATAGERAGAFHAIDMRPALAGKRADLLHRQELEVGMRKG